MAREGFAPPTNIRARGSLERPRIGRVMLVDENCQPFGEMPAAARSGPPPTTTRVGSQPVMRSRRGNAFLMQRFPVFFRRLGGH